MFKLHLHQGIDNHGDAEEMASLQPQLPLCLYYDRKREPFPVPA